MSERPLTTKQAKFVAAYKGNGVEAAKAAGYKGSYETLKQVAAENMTRPYIREAIAQVYKPEEELHPLLASKRARQDWWREFMDNPEISPRDRLKASELLARSYTDFTERVEHTGKITVEDMISGSRSE